jgi:hypothetical protein
MNTTRDAASGATAGATATAAIGVRTTAGAAAGGGSLALELLLPLGSALFRAFEPLLPRLLAALAPAGTGQRAERERDDHPEFPG